MSPLSQSPSSMGLSSHWQMPSIPSMMSSLPLHHHHHHSGYSYPQLNHLLTTQHLMHNSLLAHGLGGNAIPGIGQIHPSANSAFQALNNLYSSSLGDSKDSSGEWNDELWMCTMQCILHIKSHIDYCVFKNIILITIVFIWFIIILNRLQWQRIMFIVIMYNYHL